MSTEFDAALTYFKTEGWPHVVAQEGAIVQTLFAARESMYTCFLHWLADHRQLVFYSLFPRHVPPARIPAAAELVSRANWDLIWGNFEINLAHGGLRFKTSLTLGEAPFSPELLRPLTLGNVTAMFRLHAAIDAVIDEGLSASAAFARAI